jgi:hypothetical protein
MNQIIEEGKLFANAADMQISDMSANSPVGTTLAILERTLKVMSAVQARIHYAMKQEFKLLAGIIRDYTPEAYSYDPEEGDRKAKQADYDMVEVIPVSDPNAATMSQKVVQYQAVMQMAQANPQIYDLPELNKQMLEVLGIKNIGKLIPASEDGTPKDPVSENMAIINGKPVKAFLNQDHEAHIQVHMSMAQDPKIMQMIGQNPQAQAIQAAGLAHLNEHIAFAYRKQIEEQLGVALPAPDAVLSEEVEAQLSPLIAKAAQQLLQKNQGEAQQQQAQQQQQDPMVQMQQQELQLKQQEIQLKAQKVQADIEIDKAKLQIDVMRIQSEERKAGAQIGQKSAVDAARMKVDHEHFQQDKQAEGVKMGMDAAKTHAQQQIQRDQQDKQHGHNVNTLEHQKTVAANQNNIDLNTLMQQAKQAREAKPPTGETE